VRMECALRAVGMTWSGSPTRRLSLTHTTLRQA
jgi:hypothetical protein